MSRDLAWVGLLYEKADMPMDKRYMLRYFDTPLQESFLRYVLCFGDHVNFVDHTGLVVQERWLKILMQRYKKLEILKAQARSDMDIELLSKIESGDYKLT